MKELGAVKPLPAAVLADSNEREQEILANRIKRDIPTYFRTRSGILIRISWSKKEHGFRISNSVSVAWAATAKVAFGLVAKLNEMPDQIEVAA